MLSRGVAGPSAESISSSLAAAPRLDITAVVESDEAYVMAPTEYMKTAAEVHLDQGLLEAVEGPATVLDGLTTVDDESTCHSSSVITSASVATSANLIARTNVLLSSESTVDRILCNEDQQEPGRGRTLERTKRHKPHLASAASPLRRQKRLREVASEVCAEVMERRKWRSTALFESRSPIEDELLEPYPYNSVCHSFSAVMNESLSRIETDGSQSFWSNDTPRTNADSAKESLEGKKEAKPHCQQASVVRVIGLASKLPSEEIQPLSVISALDHRSTNSPCKVRSDTNAPQPSVESEVRIQSAALRIPVEIIHRIYFYLGPMDFNSARHASRSWFVKSLERRLLEAMLLRGASSAVLHRELSIKHSIHPQSRVSDEWLMSKILSRECALGPGWKGDGISKLDEVETSKVNPHLSHSAFKLISESDFRCAGINYPGTASRVSGLLFTASTCGKFVTVAHGCLVFIYELNRRDDGNLRSGAIKPVTTVICPRRVIACSMDTSCNRNVVAILMDDRMGLVCSISGSSSVVGGALEQRNEGLSFAHSSGEAQLTAGAYPRSQINASLRRATLKGEPNSYPPRSRKPFSMGIESSTPSIYSPLCTVDDPPRSVALCPQRCCVAFGCSTGIELHWVDALTGQDLSRWFPLTTPSDHLYFLPPRDGLDTAKKLRLISSAGRPGERTVIADRYSSGDNVGPRRSRRSAVFDRLTNQGNIGGMTDMFANNVFNVRPERGRDDTDHFRAVPVSDGYHILFTDPLTGLLCLGTDAPVGGPTKLYRKICFKVPPEQGSPVVYASGNDLRRGVKIAAAYGIGREQTVWLFSVPADVFVQSQLEAGCTIWATDLSCARTAAAPGWLKWREKRAERTEALAMVGWASGSSDGSAGALLISGQFIGKMQDVVDLAIDSGPQMTIWAFARSGIAKTWKFDDGSWNGRIRKRIVTRDGSVRDADAEGDVEMTTATHAAGDERTFDGTASLQVPGPQFTDDYVLSGDHQVEIDADGDFSMEDSPYCCREEESAVQNEMTSRNVYWVPDDDDVGFYSHSYTEQVSRTEFVEQDMLVESMQVARIDIDIR